MPIKNPLRTIFDALGEQSLTSKVDVEYKKTRNGETVLITFNNNKSSKIDEVEAWFNKHETATNKRYPPR
jgi:hypothetical protein